MQRKIMTCKKRVMKERREQRCGRTCISTYFQQHRYTRGDGFTNCLYCFNGGLNVFLLAWRKHVHVCMPSAHVHRPSVSLFVCLSYRGRVAPVQEQGSVCVWRAVPNVLSLT